MLADLHSLILMRELQLVHVLGLHLGQVGAPLVAHVVIHFTHTFAHALTHILVHDVALHLALLHALVGETVQESIDCVETLLLLEELVQRVPDESAPASEHVLD